MTEEQEDTIYEEQHTLILERFGPEAAAAANYGWGVDEIEGYVATKVYGHGVLVSTIGADGSIDHEFEERR